MIGVLTTDVVNTLELVTENDDVDPAIDVVIVGCNIDDDVVTGCDNEGDNNEGDKSGLKKLSPFSSTSLGETTSVFTISLPLPRSYFSHICSKRLKS